MNYEEKTLSVEEVYDGKVIKVEVLKVELPDGREASRDIVRHSGGAAVVPLNENNEIYLVRQFRKPLDKIMLEIPAGKLDKGEDPFVCAVRELKEETGLTAKEVKHLVSVYSTPGFSDEVLHLYLATGLSQGDSCTDSDEFLSVEKIPLDRLVEMVINHDITDAKTVMGILFAERMLGNK